MSHVLNDLEPLGPETLSQNGFKGTNSPFEDGYASRLVGAVVGDTVSSFSGSSLSLELAAAVGATEPDDPIKTYHS